LRNSSASRDGRRDDAPLINHQDAEQCHVEHQHHQEPNAHRETRGGAAIADQLGVPAQIDADWDEQSFGDWDDKTIGHLAASHPQELLRFREDPHYARPGGEAHADLEVRVLAAFGRATAVGGTVVVASHRKPIMTVLAHVLGIPHERIWRLATAPASLTSVEVWDDGGTSVAFVNDTSHLR